MRQTRLVSALGLLAGGFLGALVAAYFLPLAPGTRTLAIGWLAAAAMATAGATALARGLGRAPAGWRCPAWAVIGAGLVAFAVGDVLWIIVPGTVLAGTVSASDAAYLVGYPVLLGGLVLLAWRRVPAIGWHRWLDSGLVAAGTLVILSFAIGQRLLTEGPVADAASIPVNLAFVACDVLLIATAAFAANAFAWRPPRAWGLLIIALVTIGTGDAVYLVQVATATYAELGWVNVLWPAGAMAIALAAIVDDGQVAPIRSPRSVVAPTVAVAGCLALLVLEPESLAMPFMAPLAGLVIALALVQFNLAVRDARGEREQRRLARTDDLTGLSNRRALSERGEGTTGRGALVLLDLDGFKEVNDRFGHKVGDAILEVIGQRLAAAVRPQDTIARIGGDEFAAIVPGAEVDEAVHVAMRMLACIDEPISLGPDTFRMTASAGIDAATDFELQVMLQRADRALYAAKAEGRACVRVAVG